MRAVGVPVLTPQLDIANARLEFEGGCVANLTASRVSAGKVRKLPDLRPALYVSVDMQSRTVKAFRLARGKAASRRSSPPRSRSGAEEPLAREMADFARRGA